MQPRPFMLCGAFQSSFIVLQHLTFVYPEVAFQNTKGFILKYCPSHGKTKEPNKHDCAVSMPLLTKKRGRSTPACVRSVHCRGWARRPATPSHSTCPSSPWIYALLDRDCRIDLDGVLFINIDHFCLWTSLTQWYWYTPLSSGDSLTEPSQHTHLRKVYEVQ